MTIAGTLFDLQAKITLDTKDYEKGIGNAESKASGFASKLKSGLGTAAKVGAAALTASAAAVGAVSTAMVNGVKQTAEYGDNIDKMSQKMGMTAQAYQEWDFIMQHNGTTIESMKASMKTLANAAETGNDAFGKLGITQEQMASMSQEELFGATIKGLQNVSDDTERTYLAGQLLGRGATELGSLLNMSAEDTEAMRQQVHDLGGVMSDEAVKDAAAFQDSLQNLRTAFGGLKRGLTSEFMPAITTVMDGLTAVISGDDSGLGKVNEGVSEFASKLAEHIPQIMEVGAQIVNGILDAIIQNLPTLISSGVSAIETIGMGLLQNLPLLLESGIQIILELANGISQNLPQLIPTIIEVVLQVINTLIENAPLLITAALQLMVQLGLGLIQAIPELVANIPEIIAAIIEGLGEGVSGIYDVGKNLVEGLWNGIGDMVGWIKEKISGFGKDVLGALKSFFGIKSPSRLMRDVIGKNLALGIGVGFEDTMPDVLNDMEGALDINPLASSVEVSASGGGSRGSSGGVGGNIINIYPQNLTEAQIDYLFTRFNAKMGAMA